MSFPRMDLLISLCSILTKIRCFKYTERKIDDLIKGYKRSSVMSNLRTLSTSIYSISNSALKTKGKRERKYKYTLADEYFTHAFKGAKILQ